MLLPINEPEHVEHIPGWSRMLALKNEPPRLGDYFTDAQGVIRDRGTNLVVRLTGKNGLASGFPFHTDAEITSYARSLVQYLNQHYQGTQWRVKLFDLGGHTVYEGHDRLTGAILDYKEFFIIGANLFVPFYGQPGVTHKKDPETGEVLGWRARFIEELA